MTKIRHDDDLFDSNGLLRDGKSVRVPMQARDSARMTERQRHQRVSDTLRDVNSKPLLVTDGRTDDTMSLHKPGWRIPVVNDRANVRDAYANYETSLVNAYRVGDGEMQCPTCFGSGVLNGEDCDDCDGTGIMPDVDSESNDEGGGYGSTNEGPSNDSHTVDLKQHRETMDRLIRDRDFADSNAWRGGKG
jgi:hypothetical protein